MNLRNKLKKIQETIDRYNTQFMFQTMFSSTDKNELKKLGETLYHELNDEFLDINENYAIQWIMQEYIKAVIRNASILLDRIENKDKTLNEDRKKKNDIIINIVNGFINDTFLNLNDDTFFGENGLLKKKIEGDYEVYYVKNVALFRDSLIPETNINTGYHGTSLYNAKPILDGGFQGDNLKGYNMKSFYNKDKIFFSDNFEVGKEYATITNADGVIFSVNLSNYSVYKREHLLVERETQFAYFVKNVVFSKDIDKIYYLYKNSDCIEVDKEFINFKKDELLKMEI